MPVDLARGAALPIAWALAALLVGIGVFALAAPKRLADFYGAPTGARGFPFVRAAGWRDLVVGLILAAVAYRRDRVTLGIVAAAGILLALGDGTIAWMEQRRFSQPLIAHLAGALAFLVLLETVIWP